MTVCAVAALGLSACTSDNDTTSGSGGGGAPAPSQPSDPSDIPEPTETDLAPDTAGSPDTPESTESDDSCVDETGPEVIEENIGNLPPPSAPDTHWEFTGDTDLDPCDDLSYATVVQQPQGNAQFENQLMLFHQGRYSGFPPTEAPQQHEVIETSEDSVTVRYKDWEALNDAGAPNAEAPNYTTDVTYRWVDDRVVTEGQIPNEGL